MEEFDDDKTMRARARQLNRLWLSEYPSDAPEHVGGGRHVEITEDTLPHYFGEVETREGGGGTIKLRQEMRGLKKKPLTKKGMKRLLDTRQARKSIRKLTLAREAEKVAFADIAEAGR